MRSSFYEVLTDAVNDILDHGYSQRRLEEWMERITVAAHSALVPLSELQRTLNVVLLKAYTRATGSALAKRHKGIDEYTLAAIKPKLRHLLDDRIMANADLIRLNREEAITKTLRRFAGWATSIPTGGTKDRAVRRKAKGDIRKGIAGLPYVERRVVIDQGHKLSAAIHEVVAVDGGAIAGIWHSHWREAGYDFRPEHKARDGKFYVVPGNWALDKGLMKLAGHEYTSQITAPGEEPFCRCYLEYVYTLRDLPDDMLTAKGRDALTEARRRQSDFHGALL